MCRIYNTIGSLSFIQSHLIRNDFDEFHSLDELINFQKNYHFTEQKVISEHTSVIQKEKENLEENIAELNKIILESSNKLEDELKQRLFNLNKQIENLPAPNSNFISIISDYYNNTLIWTKIWLTPIVFRIKIINLKRKSKKSLYDKITRFNFIENNFQEAVKESSSIDLQLLQRQSKIVKEINNSIYGAIGEQKVVNTLEKLSDEFILINDFSCCFQNPIKNRNENDFIKSIQIDHLLISPSGIFIIETKNWSKHSQEKLNLFSPVQQVKRTNYALYRLLADSIKKINGNFAKHQWGDRKIPIRNIIVFTNEKPTEEFQFVKILGLNQLLSYINYFEPCFKPNEVEAIAEFLKKISVQKNIVSRLTVSNNDNLR
ncbi:nuclease-related domain-containing protein [Flavobacterium sp. XGLA_31]|uniref:nuclease-related domain-containing protein n=1 Tax=Flavobacterium sp. XGLA_31 TaxID=3447666 RepID=UPI003F30E06A